MGEVTELRVALTVADFDEAVAFYRDAVGLVQLADWSGEDGRVIVLEAGRATLEIFDQAQAEKVDAIEAGDRVSGVVRLALEVEDSEAAAKWERVQLTAGQLPTYFIGAQEHLALRDEARRRWGKGFTLKRYHDTVLSFGSPPVRYARALMFDLPIED